MSAAALLLAWPAASAVTAGWAWLRAPRDAAPRPPVADEAVLVLRPCAGREPWLSNTLDSSRAAGPRAQARFLLSTANDSACPDAFAATVALRAAGLDAAVTLTEARGPNRKADQLARALGADPAPGARLVLVADSDVLLSPPLVSAVVAPIASGEADAVWAPPVERAPSTWADRVSAGVLDASLHAFPLLAGLDGKGMVGKVFAVRRDALERLGGFGAFTSHLGEDVELARRMRRQRMRVVASPVVAVSAASGRSLDAVVARYGRWIAVVRAQRPWLMPSYPLLIAAAPLQIFLALWGLAAGAPVAVALASLSATVATRLGIALVARSRAQAPSLFEGILWVPWAADLVLLAAFVAALASRTIRWRGVTLRLRSSGTVVEIPP